MGVFKTDRHFMAIFCLWILLKRMSKISAAHSYIHHGCSICCLWSREAAKSVHVVSSYNHDLNRNNSTIADFISMGRIRTEQCVVVCARARASVCAHKKPFLYWPPQAIQTLFSGKETAARVKCTVQLIDSQF